jgi:hypothetical protein
MTPHMHMQSIHVQCMCAYGCSLNKTVSEGPSLLVACVFAILLCSALSAPPPSYIAALEPFPAPQPIPEPQAVPATHVWLYSPCRRLLCQVAVLVLLALLVMWQHLQQPRVGSSR